MTCRGGRWPLVELMPLLSEPKQPGQMMHDMQRKGDTNRADALAVGAWATQRHAVGQTHLRPNADCQRKV